MRVLCRDGLRPSGRADYFTWYSDAPAGSLGPKDDQEDAVRVLGYTWAGVRTSDLGSSLQFFSDILGLRCLHQGQGFVQFELPSGQLFEVFSSESRYYQFHNCPVIGFQVEDVRVAMHELELKGIQFITEVFGDDKEAWVYFRGPDGYLYEMWQTQRPLKALG